MTLFVINNAAIIAKSIEGKIVFKFNLTLQKKHIFLWFWYDDDIITSFDGTMRQLIQFLHAIKNIYPKIKSPIET